MIVSDCLPHHEPTHLEKLKQHAPDADCACWPPSSGANASRELKQHAPDAPRAGTALWRRLGAPMARPLPAVADHVDGGADRYGAEPHTEPQSLHTEPQGLHTEPLSLDRLSATDGVLGHH